MIRSSPSSVGAFQSNYQGRRVLVTGHTGFKGSWLTLWLKELGADLAGYSLPPPTEKNAFHSLGLQKVITDFRGDIRDKVSLEKAFEEFQPEVVFHLAAQPLVRRSYELPLETYETNVIGTLNVYEACRKTASIKAVVSITTDKCYENREWVWGYRENDPMGGYDPYSASKGCAEILSSSYRSSFWNLEKYGKDHHVLLATARAGNVIGGGDWAIDRLIPDCIRALSSGKEIKLRHPDATRPWQHVLEPLAGYLWLGSRLLAGQKQFAEGWNFGPEDQDVLSVLDMVKLTCKAWGNGSWRVEPAPAMHEAHLLKLDISKARALLGWRPVYRSDEAIDATVGWYSQESKDPTVMKNFSTEQIHNFTKSAAAKQILWAL